MTPPAALGRLVVLAVLTAGWLLSAAGSAAAHPALVSSSPGAGYAVTDPPREITLSFNEPVTLPDRPLVVRDAAGAPVGLRVRAGQDGAALVGVPVVTLDVGAYEIAYRVVGQDGDLITGTVPFGVATPVGAAGTTGGAAGSEDDASEAVPAGTAVLRGLLFLGLALALGGGYLAWRVDDATGGLPGGRPLLRTGSAAALLATVGLLAELGDLSRLLATATEPGVGRLLGLQALLLAVAAVFARRPVRGALAVLMLLLVVALEGARAHPGEATGLVGAVLTVTHLLAGALWLGGLVHVLRLAVAWRSRPRAVLVAAETYARNALSLFVLVTVTGTVSAWTLLPAVADWTGTTYGRLLLVKIAVFLVVVALAVAGRARLRQTLAPAREAQSAEVPAPAGVAPRRPFGRIAAVETALLATVVLAAAVVTTLTPARLRPVSALVAAPVGPTARVAERVAQVSVSVVASEGRLEVRAHAPDGGAPSTVGLTGRVTASGATRDLELAPCGPRCWTGLVEWQPGTNVLTFDVDAEPHEAGRVAIHVPWPALPAPAVLARVQQAMGARTAVDTVETVTSGFGTVLPHRSRRTGQQFLEGQPWAQGGATDVILVEEAGRRTLLFALPALGYHFAMRLDDADRIVSERIVTPNHLLTREYRYP